MRKYGAEELSCRSIFERAATLCSKLGLRCPSYDTVYNMFRSAFPLPIIVENGRVRIWIDRYYIAHCMEDGEVRYVYLARRHISEETASFRNAARNRDGNYRLPAEIGAQFKKAKKFMRSEHSNIWVEA